MRATYQYDGARNVLAVAGELDLSTAAMFAEALQAADERRPLAVDMSRVRFIDSAGLRELAHEVRRRRLDGTVLRIVDASSTVRARIEIVALDSFLEMAPQR